MIKPSALLLCSLTEIISSVWASLYTVSLLSTFPAGNWAAQVSKNTECGLGAARAEKTEISGSVQL
jgi:hypothetical protein